MTHETHIHPRDYRSLSLTHRRSQYCNYAGRGIYLITLCTEGRRPLLGELCGDSPARAHIRPSELGREVLRCWEAIPAIQRDLAAQKSLRTHTTCQREIELLGCQLMPDHFHGIIFIQQPMDIPLGQVVRGFMMGCTQAYHTMLKSVSIPTVLQHPGYCSTVGIHTDTKSAYLPTTQHPGYRSTVGIHTDIRSTSLPTSPLWEKGFHDRPLTRKGQLQTMIAYLHDNPRRLFVRRHSARAFELRHGVQVGAQVFDAMGNHALLQRPMHAVHVRRRFTDAERRAYMNNCILAARQGRVLVGAFISEYEQQVRAVALREGHAVIQLTTDLLTDYYKPSGELFDACGRGQVLLLSQRTTLDSFSRRITRAECNTLNALAEELAGCELPLTPSSSSER